MFGRQISSLERYGFSVRVFGGAQDALAAFDAARPAVVVSDVMMPGMDGLAFLRALRAKSDVPVILLTARGEVADKVLGLELGADDYVPKPFEPRELVARLQSLLRRMGAPRPVERLAFRGLLIEPAAQRVTVDGHEVVLTSTEFDVLVRLASRAGTIVSRDTLMEEVRGIEWESYNRSIDVMVSKLRSKLGCDAHTPRFIKTIRGAGYLFVGELA
jgi:two-component system OmpR family response regulator